MRLIYAKKCRKQYKISLKKKDNGIFFPKTMHNAWFFNGGWQLFFLFWVRVGKKQADWF